MTQAVSTEQVVAAYLKTGSVWRAGRLLGLSGQSVWERLRAIGHPMRNRLWSSEEVARLYEMAGEFTITQIAHELGRPYGSVAERLSRLGVSGRLKRPQQKLPRGAGFDKETIRRRIRELDLFGGSIRQYARANGVRLDPLIKAIQRHDLAWWNRYVRSHSDLPAERCAYCEAEFYPMTKRQKTCSRRCQSHLRTDQSYYGGRRKYAVGMAEGVCQLCEQQKPVLAAHHALGKENDPDNEVLVALCNGCHQTVGQLAGRKFTEQADGWEALINLVMLRRMGGQPDLGGVHTVVQIQRLTAAEVAEEMGNEPLASVAS